MHQLQFICCLRFRLTTWAKTISNQTQQPSPGCHLSFRCSSCFSTPQYLATALQKLHNPSLHSLQNPPYTAHHNTHYSSLVSKTELQMQTIFSIQTRFLSATRIHLLQLQYHTIYYQNPTSHLLRLINTARINSISTFYSFWSSCNFNTWTQPPGSSSYPIRQILLLATSSPMASN